MLLNFVKFDVLQNIPHNCSKKFLMLATFLKKSYKIIFLRSFVNPHLSACLSDSQTLDNPENTLAYSTMASVMKQKMFLTFDTRRKLFMDAIKTQTR